MNRKDTIIIAVLINAGLLALLFMMAINTDDEVVQNQSLMPNVLAQNQTQQREQPSTLTSSEPLNEQLVPSAKILADAGSVDEMDNFLNDFSAKGLSHSAFLDDEGSGGIGHELANQTSQDEQEDAASTSDTRIVTVTVKRGDALEKIARSNGTTVGIIKKINHLSSSKLSIGQVLRVPVPANTSIAEKKQTTKSLEKVASKTDHVIKTETAAPLYYTIKSGDNPWKIAKQHHVKYNEILKLNGIDEAKARNLKIGDIIRVK